jgi:hypothetical protein
MKMNPDVKAKWVAALRSGEYKQGPEWLQGESGCFCCLGVLCDILDPEGWHGTKHRGEDELPRDEVLTAAGCKDLPPGA